MTNPASLKLARRYVTALFGLAAKAGVTEAVEKDLAALAAAAEENKDFAVFLANPLLTRAQSAQAMEALLDKSGAQALTRQFARLLARHRRLAALPAVYDLFAREAAAARGEIEANLTSAAPLAAPDIAAVAGALGKAYGKKVTVKSRVDPELLGGIVVRVGSTQLDSSLAGKLARLRNVLKAA